MIWLLRAAGVAVVVPAALLVGLVAGLLRGEQAPVPSLGQAQMVPVPVVAMVAALPVVAAIWSWSQIPLPSVAGAVRGPAWHLTVLVVGPFAYVAASAAFGGVGAMVENGRNCAGLLGIGLVGMRLFGERGGVAAPVLYLLASLLGGRTAGSQAPSAWAWILRDGGDVSALSVAAVLSLAGLAGAGALPRVLLRRGEG